MRHLLTKIKTVLPVLCFENHTNERLRELNVQNKLKENIDFILDRIDEIKEKNEELDIHDMADLARYTKSLKEMVTSLEIARDLRI